MVTSTGLGSRHRSGQAQAKSVGGTAMNTKQHIGIVFSAVWLIGAFLFALRSGDIHGFMSFFTLFGVVPLTVGWSIWWIFRHGRPPGTASK
jgi:hypothetical protein